MSELSWTGERMVTDYIHYGSIEHLHRYAIVAELLNKEMILVDVACGEGYGTSFLSGYCKHITGVDISESAIAHAKAKYTPDNISFICASGLNMPLEDNYADLVVSFETIEHLMEHTELIEEFSRVLKPEGILLISTPDKRYLSEIPHNPFHVRELDYSEFSDLLEKHFSNARILFQKEVYGSLIFDMENPSRIKQLNGSFEEVNENENLTGSEFCIGLASNKSLNDVLLQTSLFDAKSIHEKRIQDLRSFKKKYIDIVYTRKFKIVNKILSFAGIGFKVR